MESPGIVLHGLFQRSSRKLIFQTDRSYLSDTDSLMEKILQLGCLLCILNLCVSIWNWFMYINMIYLLCNIISTSWFPVFVWFIKSIYKKILNWLLWSLALARCYGVLFLVAPVVFWNCRKNIWMFPKRGTSKSSILIGFSFIYHPFWGTPIFGNPAYVLFISPFLWALVGQVWDVLICHFWKSLVQHQKRRAEASDRNVKNCCVCMEAQGLLCCGKKVPRRDTW